MTTLARARWLALPAALLLGVAAADAGVEADRIYHQVALKHVATTRWTHICTTGPVVYVRKQRDGDWHITLDDGYAKVVVEIVPAIVLPRPAKGDVIAVCGITRFDRAHCWAEIHPAETLTVLSRKSAQ